MKKEEKIEIQYDRVEPREITDEVREAYLTYAMSVIVSRALPDVRDGLKPVQRRILWAMWDTGLVHSAKYKKSANVVGEVLGKYHPHGDMAVYDAMARMAQDFSLRYPLVDGQGNWGSIDGDPPAAMRYTEARLTSIAEESLLDIEKETVDWQQNYDASRVEPKVLPAKLPNLLINGTVGIAVGMATSIPPHHLGEVADATVFLADNPDATTKDLMKFIPGPDFPTGGIIYNKASLEEAYTTGKGSITIRGVAEIEEEKRAPSIIITEIPYQVNKSTLITQIANLVQNKKIEGVRDVRDESDRDGLRIAIDLKTDGSPQKILNQLFEYTELQKNFYFNMLALEDGLQPRVLSLKEVLAAYLVHRKNVIRRRTEFDLKKAKERAHILEGLVIALDDIDAVIATIKKSKDRDNAKENLIKKFSLTEVQAVAILEMRLQTLAALERVKIENELKEKRKIIKDLEFILAHPKEIVSLIKSELTELKEKRAGERKTKLVAGGLKEFKEEDLVAEENVIITVSNDGYIKRMSPTAFKVQGRGGKGIVGFELKDEDSIAHIISASTHDSILFFTDKGKVYQTRAFDIPVASRTAKGKSIHNVIELSNEEAVTAVIAYGKDEAGALFMATTQGFVKQTPLKDFLNVRKNGIIAISLKKGDELRWAALGEAHDEVILVSANGQSIHFKVKDVRPTGRTSVGIRAIRLKNGDTLTGLDIIRGKSEGVRFLVVMANGFAKQTPLKEFKLQRRGGSGIRAAHVTEKTGKVIAAYIVRDENEEIIAFSSKGQALRTSLKSVRITSRSTQGVRIMNLEKGDSLSGVVCL